ncbi:TRAP transporter substrate-binding protein DctP [Variovorax guangxiensis]|uniref:TRAP transporter substrate-binding protein DctP n=1 Tax=Variovorax guangxiensis TaxID=1775474 RepID=UPI0028644749|nr:TRAP transporter substrate-binding protein DctP [Variovorax guangxiensis]MDR6858646.1 TRAP-type C4-dicarboxylate transport system substrate-binding protein [Variovorax guangxiensis]
MQNAIHLNAASAYPKGTLPGMGLSRFSKELRVLSSAQATVECHHDLPLQATSILHAVRRGDFQIGELYCGALSTVDRLFQIGSMPFQSSTRASAMQLLAVARPHYEQTFERLGVRLLYVSPWPPTGLWTRQPVHSRTDFERLRISTYDDMSADVVRSAGGQAVHMPIGKALDRLRDGQLEGVLSSGDGAAGQRLGKYLRCFYDIKYATPISFAVMNAALYHGLAVDQRRLVDQAAQAIERSLWSDLDGRIRQNRCHMIAAGVQVFSDLDAKLKQALWEGGHKAINQWEQGACGQTASILGEYFPSPQGR